MPFEAVFMFAGAALLLYVGQMRSRAHSRLVKKGEKVTARIEGHGQSSKLGSYCVLRFETAGGVHRLHYPLPKKGCAIPESGNVTLYYDPEDPAKLFVEGDKSELYALRFYFICGAVLALLGVLIWLR